MDWQQGFIDFDEVARRTEDERRAKRLAPRVRLSGTTRIASAAAFLALLVAPLTAVAGDSGHTALDGPLWIHANVPGAPVLTGRNDASEGQFGRASCRTTDKGCLLVKNLNSGAAAKFTTEDGSAPFIVTSSAMVEHLNANRVEGMHAQEIIDQAVALGAGGRTPTGPAGGDLTGTYPDPAVAAGAITDAKVAPQNIDGSPAVPSLRTLGTGAAQAAAGNDPRLSDGRVPIGTAGGDLTGTYPSPAIANGAIDSIGLFDSALRDGATGTPTLRSLGTGANEAAAGNDPRLSNARTPTGSAGGDLTGTYPNPTIGDNTIDTDNVVDNGLHLDDISRGSSVSVNPSITLAANTCAVFQGTSNDVQNGDIIEVFPRVDSTDNDLGVEWWGGTQPGGGTITFTACNLNDHAAKAGGSLPVRIWRP